MDPVDYIIKPAGPALGGCEVIRGEYSFCPNTTLLLDSIHGPENFTQAALNRFYTQFTDGERTLFKFSSEVHLEVIQVYYFAAAISEELSRISFTFYSINDDRYVPRRQIPQGAKQLAFTTDFDLSGYFNSFCFTLGSSVKNLLVASTLMNTELHVSEVNFFTSPVSDAICRGEYTMFPTKGKDFMAKLKS